MISPKISIITACYNSDKTITDTIESILNQDYKNIEYLIIDGGSTDTTVSIIKRYEEQFDGRLKWISESDKGVYDAWNKGLKISTGDWISFVGSDDILLHNSILEYVKVINEDCNLNFISSKCLLVKENIDPIRIYGKPWSNKMNSYCCIAHVGSLHRIDLFSQKGDFNSNYHITGDYDFLLRCRDIIKPYFISTVTVKVRDGGISGRNIYRVANERMMVKISNKSKMKFICYFDYFITIFKYYLRVNFINHLPLLPAYKKYMNDM